MSCKNSLSIEAIKKEYDNIKEDSNIEIMSLEIIEEHEPTFEELANREFDRMKRLNGNLAQIIEAQFKIDSLLKENINQRNCFHKNAVKAYQLKYEAENREDSIRLDKEMRERINNELEYHENQLKMLEIESQIKTDSTLLEQSKWIKHAVQYKIGEKVVSDTVIYIEFGKVKYSYLTKNIYRKNE